MVGGALGRTLSSIEAGVMSIMDSSGSIGDFADWAALMTAWARSLEDSFCLKKVDGFIGLFLSPGFGRSRNMGRGSALGMTAVSSGAGRGSGAASLFSFNGMGYGFQSLVKFSGGKGMTTGIWIAAVDLAMEPFSCIWLCPVSIFQSAVSLGVEQISIADCMGFVIFCMKGPCVGSVVGTTLLKFIGGETALGKGFCMSFWANVSLIDAVSANRSIPSPGPVCTAWPPRVMGRPLCLSRDMSCQPGVIGLSWPRSGLLSSWRGLWL